MYEAIFKVSFTKVNVLFELMFDVSYLPMLKMFRNFVDTSMRYEFNLPLLHITKHRSSNIERPRG